MASVVGYGFCILFVSFQVVFGQPNPPTMVQVENITHERAVLTWKPPENENASDIGFKITLDGPATTAAKGSFNILGNKTSFTLMYLGFSADYTASIQTTSNGDASTLVNSSFTTLSVGCGNLMFTPGVNLTSLILSWSCSGDRFPNILDPQVANISVKVEDLNTGQMVDIETNQLDLMEINKIAIMGRYGQPVSGDRLRYFVTITSISGETSAFSNDYNLTSPGSGFGIFPSVILALLCGTLAAIVSTSFHTF